ncbi:DNA translocase FtsK 4TM domain-containing protein [bacterium]|nr:DNA translocase FtsK 4TM domain-containing protein [bacterium]
MKRTSRKKAIKRYSRRYSVIAGILLILVAVLLIISVVSFSPSDYTAGMGKILYSKELSNRGGVAGAYLAKFIIRRSGYLSLLLTLIIVIWGINRITGENTLRTFKASIFILVSYILLATLVSLPIKSGENLIAGSLGDSFAQLAESWFGSVGAYLVVGVILLLVLTLVTGVDIASIFPHRERLPAHLRGKRSRGDNEREKRRQELIEEYKRSQEEKFRRFQRAETYGELRPGERHTQSKKVEEELEEFKPPSILRRKAIEKLESFVSKTGEEQPTVSESQGTEEETVSTEEKVEVSGRPEEPSVQIAGTGGFQPPPVTLLDPPLESVSISDGELAGKAKLLVDKLASFNVTGEVKRIIPGPVVTRFEFKPDEGIKVSKIISLEDDLALALKARSVRILAPVPGKDVVGVEIPNNRRETVHLREIIASKEFVNSESPLAFALGKDVSGNPVVAELDKMPHLLVAGATGSGKSVCINSIITSLIYKNPPKELRFILIDPKRLELSLYNDIPYLAHPVITELKYAKLALKWATDEMDSRYRALEKMSVRNLIEYNQKSEEPLPFIVVVIDELADLMVRGAAEVEESITRLAQMARAVGIHLIVATQRPSVDVITGLIKANFPARIAFKTRSKIDSRTIIDMNGAEVLLGSGDMLFLPPWRAEPIRVHGSYISTEETERVVDCIKRFPNPYPHIQLEKLEERQAKKLIRDELFEEAARIIVMYQQGSSSFLQRKLRVGYTRAASLIDQLESAGIVGPHEGSKAREVIPKTLDELDEILRNL